MFGSLKDGRSVSTHREKGEKVFLSAIAPTATIMVWFRILIAEAAMRFLLGHILVNPVFRRATSKKSTRNSFGSFLATNPKLTKTGANHSLKEYYKEFSMIDVTENMRLLVKDILGIVPLDRAPVETGGFDLHPDLNAALFEGHQRTFVILDAAKIPQLAGLFDSENIEARCLFTGEAAEEYGEVAPWIAELKGDERLLRLLFSKAPEISALWQRSAAVFVRADATLTQVWSHFRRHTKVPRVNGPDLYFRFWDPEVAHFYYNGVSEWPERVKSLLVSRHAVIDRIIAPTTEDEGARVFLLQDTPKQGGSGPALRLEERDLQVLGEMQWPKLERELTDWLRRADPVRFRGFNKKRRQVLAAHAIKEGRAFGLSFKEEYAYFLYMMTFLGGWFHTAPQFSHFNRLLAEGGGTRYLDLKRDFPKVYAERFGHMGKPSDVLRQLQGSVETCLAEAGGWAGLKESDVAAITQEIERRLQWKDTEIAVVRADAAAQAIEIGLQTPYGRELHYLLWLLVGPHYLTDPLFPWAAEVFETVETPDDAIVAVTRYAHRRMNRTLSIQRILTRAKV